MQLGRCSTTEKEIETYVKDWLRHAKFRSGGKEKSVCDKVTDVNNVTDGNNSSS